MLKTPDQLTLLKVSAASGLVKHEDMFYIVSDDENSLFGWDGNHHEFLLLPGTLPEEKKARKELKPDFEALVIWDDELLAMPSLSKPNRVKGVFFNPKTRTVRTIDFSGLRTALLSRLSELNIEGAGIHEEMLYLFQRGNGEEGINAIVKIDKKALNIHSVTNINLGQKDGVNFGFTDAFIENGMVYFLAVTETAKSTYDDGKFTGAIIGKMGLEGTISETLELKAHHKPEGLWMDNDKIYIVTDADDRGIPSGLYSIPRPRGF